MSNRFNLNPMTTPTDASLLNLDEVRDLAHWCNDQNENLWFPYNRAPLTIGQILALWHATAKADYYTFDDWQDADIGGALAAWNRIVNGAAS